VLHRDPVWGPWSDEALIEALGDGVVLVNQVVYSEISMGFPAVEECDFALNAQGIERIPIPWPAAFLAGRAYLEYRRRGGSKSSLLPDFFIGAHAAVEGLRVLTRDSSRYQTYFPTVELIAPE
jgi:predicted nucleic acid-binding protein